VYLASTAVVLGDVALGKDCYAAMVDDGLSSALLKRFSLYALFYWTLGRDRADERAQAMWGGDKEPTSGEAKGR